MREDEPEGSMNSEDSGVSVIREQIALKLRMNLQQHGEVFSHQKTWRVEL